MQYSINRRQVRKSTKTRDRNEAEAIMERTLEAHKQRLAAPPNVGLRPWYPNGEVIHIWGDAVDLAMESSGSWLRRLYQRTKDRAKRKEIYWTLSLNELYTLALHTGGFCPLSGLRFDWERPNGCNIPPLAPSLDRIEPRLGYTLSNCRMVAHAVNVALSDWGEEVAVQIAEALVSNRS